MAGGAVVAGMLGVTAGVSQSGSLPQNIHCCCSFLSSVVAQSMPAAKLTNTLTSGLVGNGSHLGVVERPAWCG